MSWVEILLCICCKVAMSRVGCAPLRHHTVQFTLPILVAECTLWYDLLWECNHAFCVAGHENVDIYAIDF